MSVQPSARPLLAPLTPLYRLALGWRELRLRRAWETVNRLQHPVVSIGNISTGGAGKTPLAIALAQALARRGMAVDVLSRGYGRRSTAPAQVDPQGSYEAFGDEPLHIARAAHVPVYVARQRFEAGQLAESFSAPPALHLLDDGFQHRQLHRDADIVLVNADNLRDTLLPTGNLREPIAALRRATILAIPADESDAKPDTEAALRALGFHQPLWRIRRSMQVPAITGPVIAFCGIARPEQFFTGLAQAGLDLVVRKAYADHHRYTAAELMQLASAALAAGATLLTTEKDAMRLASLLHLLPAAVELKTAGLVSEIADEDAALDGLLAHIAHPETSR
jgi:tetraacyldisaccharide 4'-kinase